MNYHAKVDAKIAELRALLTELDDIEPTTPTYSQSVTERVDGMWLHHAGRHSQYLNI